MFPLKDKEHQMKLRKEEVFITEHANTERFLKSSIPYMQRLMNKQDDDVKINKRMPG